MAATSLTGARARNRGVANGSQPVGASEYWTSSDGNARDGANDDDDYDAKDEKRQHNMFPVAPAAVPYAAPASRPFGSATAATKLDASINGSDGKGLASGWVTSGAYKGDRGKGKLKPNAGGPLRDYGGGLGVVGQGEFKLLVVVTLLASVVRLWRLDRPSSVVFDEVHFGGQCQLPDKPVDSSLRARTHRLCFQIHQWQILHGCASPAGQNASYLHSLVCWLQRRFRF